MTQPPNAPPSKDSSSSTLLLQRRLSRGDSHKWRSVLRFTAEQAQAVQSMVAAAQLIDCAVIWRVCREPDGRGQAVHEAALVRT